MTQPDHTFLAESIPQQVWTATADGALDYVNSVVTRYFDQTSEAMLGAGWQGFIHPDDLPACIARWTRSLATGEDYEFEFRLRRSDGVYRWHLGRAVAMRDANGKLARWFGTNTDVDDYKRLQAELQRQQEALRDAEARFRGLFMQTPAALCLLTGPDHTYELANPSYIELIGGRSVLGKPLKDALPELREQGFIELLDEVRRTGQHYVGKGIRAALDKHSDGKLEDRYFDFVYEPVRAVDGTVEGIMVVAQDVTEQLLARQRVDAARERAELSEQRFQLLTEVIPQIVWSMNTDATDSYLTPQWFKYTGQPEDMPIAERWRAAIHPDDYDRCFSTWAEAQKIAGVWELEYRLRRADGVYRWFLGRSAPLLDREGKIVRWYGAATDIDEQRNAIRTRDDLLATVSHDLRTPLGTIFLQAGMLAKMPQDRPIASQGPALAIVRAAQRMDQLIRDLLDMASIESGHLSVTPRPEVVRELVDEAVETIQPVASSRHLRILLELPSEPLRVRADRGRVLQVLANILGNAVKFTPPSGTIAVKAHRDDSAVTFVVADTGPGITPDQLRYVFDRFWQAQETAKAGTGLGLAICKGIIEQHGGRIWVESRAGAGASFFFTLPIG
jgi:PAS domain S-box-containing protein